ncbi:cysteine proteinase [Delitschia confertaspora ATCC 74209]|uniref:Cysteine proteinase n=1 Tax=Delitschia confertaspora ATCC 74209 TaxID=1513339 RepID=A0A9P4JSY2_9PLEO|nr:cysteine proteinase [Delitschia confertaspora ATCC 74209]
MSSLSAAQVEAYLDRISLPEPTKSLLISGKTTSENALEAITALQQHHVAAIPYDNLALHYSAHKSLPQDTESVFQHVVLKRRGGTCIQVNLLFLELLRSLGFNAYCTAGRLNAQASIAQKVGPASAGESKESRAVFGTWVHVHIIINLHSQKYMLDTSFNQFGSPSPVPLLHDSPEIDVGPGRQRRMLHAPLPGFTNSEQIWWRMQLRNSDSEPWMDVYAFQESEWLPFDFAIMTQGLAGMGVGWFKTLVVCFRWVLEKGKPVGWIMVWGDELRRCRGGKVEVERKFYSEGDRLQVLEEEFGMHFKEDEKDGIVGTGTEIVGDDFDFYG